jgi:hypothetical protein
MSQIRLLAAALMATTLSVHDAHSAEPKDPCKEACRLDGECTRMNKQCVATSKRDCERSEACSEFAHCSLDSVLGQCVTRTSDDCRRWHLCRTNGACSVDGSLCVVRTDADCRSSDTCRFRGNCRARKGSCEAGSVSDCLQSLACKDPTKVPGWKKPDYAYEREEKACVFVKKDGACITGLDCTIPCRERGRCKADNERNLCVAATEADCRASDYCKTLGHCHLDPHGRNGFAWCVIRSAADCTKTPGCKDDGDCGFIPGTEQCDVTRDADCRRSLACTERGRCTYYRAQGDVLGRCVAGSDKDCEKSTDCTKLNRCTAIRGNCEQLQEENPPTGGVTTGSPTSARPSGPDSSAPSAPPSPQPALAPELIQEVVRSRFPAIRSCYEAARKKDPKLTGRISMSFAINKDGAIANVTSKESTFTDKNLVACIEREFRTLRFSPHNADPIRVTYPIQFAPSK